MEKENQYFYPSFIFFIFNLLLTAYKQINFQFAMKFF